MGPVATVIGEASCGAIWMGMCAPSDDEGGPTGEVLSMLEVGNEIDRAVQDNLLLRTSRSTYNTSPPRRFASRPGYADLWRFAAHLVAEDIIRWLSTTGHKPVAVTPYLALTDEAGVWHIAKLGDRTMVENFNDDTWPPIEKTLKANCKKLCWLSLPELDGDTDMYKPFDDSMNRLCEHAQEPGRRSTPESERCWRCKMIGMLKGSYHS